MTRTMKNTTLIAGLAVCCTVGTADADITQVDTFVSTSTTDGLSYLDIDASDLSIVGASKLVITVGAEGANANADVPGSISSLTYGGAALTLIGSSSGGQFITDRSSIWYLDLAGVSLSGTDIDLVFAGDNGKADPNVRGYYLSAYTLANTAAGFSSFGQSSTDTTPETSGVDHTLIPISPATAGEYLIAGYSRNSTAASTNADPQTPGLSVLGGSSTPLESQYNNASIFGTLTSAGPQIIDIDGMNNTGGTVIATFAEVPEPGSLALMGIGGLLMLRRNSAQVARRRHG